MSAFKLLLAAVLVLRAGAAELDHGRWDALLRRYVTAESRVDYRSLKQNGAAELDAYLAAVAERWPDAMSPAATKAALINAYNALTMRWILSNYPVESIWRTDGPFKTPRHTVDGKRVSLDDIETRLRSMHDPRIHSALVCAARSCPPLRREAYTGDRVEQQLDDNVRAWLTDKRFNEFFPDRRLAQVSEIFHWYAGDFDAAGGVRQFLPRFLPAGTADFLPQKDSRLEYKTYQWGLNDTSDTGRDYSQLSFYLDWARNGYLWAEVKNWFFGLGRQYGVNPIIFGSIYVGAIPFFSLSIAWLIRNLRRGRSPVLPLLCASFCFVSAYLYLLIAGRNIPVWVYAFLAAMIAFGVFSTVRKVRSKVDEGRP